MLNVIAGRYGSTRLIVSDRRCSTKVRRPSGVCLNSESHWQDLTGKRRLWSAWAHPRPREEVIGTNSLPVFFASRCDSPSTARTWMESVASGVVRPRFG